MFKPDTWKDAQSFANGHPTAILNGGTRKKVRTTDGLVVRDEGLLIPAGRLLGEDADRRRQSRKRKWGIRNVG